MNSPEAPEIGVDEILKKAYKYWSKTLIYQLAFSMIYLSIFLSVLLYFSAEYGLVEKMSAVMNSSKEGLDAQAQEVQKLSQDAGFNSFRYIILGTLVFLFPLNIGFFKIYRKMDLGEQPELKDLFAGYIGSNFFKFASFYLFWLIIFSYTAPTIIFGVMWVLVTLFTAPLMFFMNKRIFESFTLNFHAVKKYTIMIFVGMLVAFLFKMMGAVTIILLPFTLPFSNAMIYTLYMHVFRELKEEVTA